MATSVNKILYKNFFIRNYFKKDLFNFSFHLVRYCNHQAFIQLLFKNFPHQFAFVILNEVSHSNIFLVFLYTRSSKINNIFIISGQFFCSVSSISIGSFSSSSFHQNYCQYIWLKFWQLEGQFPNFVVGIYKSLCVWLHSTGLENSNVNSIP